LHRKAAIPDIRESRAVLAIHGHASEIAPLDPETRFERIVRHAIICALSAI
jgi:hypothetical protein